MSLTTCTLSLCLSISLYSHTKTVQNYYFSSLQTRYCLQNINNSIHHYTLNVLIYIIFRTFNLNIIMNFYRLYTTVCLSVSIFTYKDAINYTYIRTSATNTNRKSNKYPLYIQLKNLNISTNLYNIRTKIREPLIIHEKFDNFYIQKKKC